MPDLLTSHVLTGCDTEGPCYGIGKGVALKVQCSHAHSHSCLGDNSKALADVINQAKRFMLACYGQSECHSMTEARQKLWTSKVGQSLASAPKLLTLPPTNEGFGENVARPHL